MKQRQRLEAREAVEEDMMTRVPLSKEEAKKMKQHQRAGMSGKSLGCRIVIERRVTGSLSRRMTGIS